MKEKKELNLKELYKSLKSYEIEILKHFNDEEINHYDYLFYVVNSDIISNALNTGLNILYKQIMKQSRKQLKLLCPNLFYNSINYMRFSTIF